MKRKVERFKDNIIKSSKSVPFEEIKNGMVIKVYFDSFEQILGDNKNFYSEMNRIKQEIEKALECDDKKSFMKYSNIYKRFAQEV